MYAGSGTQAEVGSASARSLGNALAPVSQMEQTLAALESMLADLHTEISHVESRIDPILSPQPAAAPINSMSQPTVSPMHSRICALSNGVADACQRLSDLRDRVQL